MDKGHGLAPVFVAPRLPVRILHAVVPWPLGGRPCRNIRKTNYKPRLVTPEPPAACPAAATAARGSWRPAARALLPADHGPCRGPAGNRSRRATPPGWLAAGATRP